MRKVIDLVNSHGEMLIDCRENRRLLQKLRDRFCKFDRRILSMTDIRFGGNKKFTKLLYTNLQIPTPNYRRFILRGTLL